MTELLQDALNANRRAFYDAQAVATARDIHDQNSILNLTRRAYERELALLAAFIAAPR